MGDNLANAGDCMDAALFVAERLRRYGRGLILEVTHLGITYDIPDTPKNHLTHSSNIVSWIVSVQIVEGVPSRFDFQSYTTDEIEMPGCGGAEVSRPSSCFNVLVGLRSHACRACLVTGSCSVSSVCLGCNHSCIAS